jgi:GNAT superfamily N-acetyltransferase
LEESFPLGRSGIKSLPTPSSAASWTEAAWESFMPEIVELSGDAGADQTADLIRLLEDAVDSGGSVGFLAPMPPGQAAQYWVEVFQEIARGRRILLVARIAGQIIGSVQLEFARRPTAKHRAEVQKLLVLRPERRRGVGAALMEAVQKRALEHNRTLLLLDARPGDAAERLYLRMGFVPAGAIPNYSRQSYGGLAPSIVMYKDLA